MRNTCGPRRREKSEGRDFISPAEKEVDRLPQSASERLHQIQGAEERPPMSKSFAAVLVLLLLAGCAPMAWTKPGATREGLARDRYSCMQEAKDVPYYGPSVGPSGRVLFKACMEAKGWTRVSQQEDR